MKPSLADGLLGMAWWNGLTRPERVYWMDVAGNTGVAADAWAAFKSNVVPINAKVRA